MSTRTCIAAIVTVLLGAAMAAGQSDGPYEIKWSTVEAGGRSSGGPYTVRGVAGQPDAGEMSGGNYTIRGGFTGGDETATGIDDPGDRPRPPAAYRLHPNVPNPFNPSTTVRFDLPAPEHVRLSVYDIGGRLVRVLRDGRLPAGSHTAVWDGVDADGNGVASGVYLLVIDVGAFRDTRKITILK